MTSPTDPTPDAVPGAGPDPVSLAALPEDPALAAAVLEIEAHVAHDGWDQPARLYALVDTAQLVDSWDRRTRGRVHRPVVRRTPEWPMAGLIVVDAATGDLLTVVSEPRSAGMPAT